MSSSVVTFLKWTGENKQKWVIWRNGTNDLYPVSYGLARLEKYLNIQDCLEKSLKIKFALENTWKTLKGLEKSLNFYHLQEDSTLSLET